MTITATEKKSRHAPLRVDSAIARLLEFSRLIDCREDVTPAEFQRIRHAFELLEQQPSNTLSKRSQREGHYLQFLKRAQKVGGRPMVLVCAAALGHSKVAAMRDRDRLLLPTEFSKHENAYKSEIIEDLVQKCSINNAQSQPAQSLTGLPEHPQVNPTESLTGDVYELSVSDARAVVGSDQLRGRIYLTNTYSVESNPFIMIQISRELSHQYATQRQQVM